MAVWTASAETEQLSNMCGNGVSLSADSNFVRALVKSDDSFKCPVFVRPNRLHDTLACHFDICERARFT